MFGGGWLRPVLGLVLLVLLLLLYSTPLSMVSETVVGSLEDVIEETWAPMALCPLCRRVLPKVELEGVALNTTTCGEDAWRRGRHQRVVAFTFFEPTGGGGGSEEKENRQYLQVPNYIMILIFEKVFICPKSQHGPNNIPSY